MRIAIGCDHRGLVMKQAIMDFLMEAKQGYHDFGCYSTASVDYPDIAREVGAAVSSGKFQQGILVCSTGIGMSIAANKVRGIRAALCYDVSAAERARQHNDANILCLRGEKVEPESVLEIVRAYLAHSFEGGRHVPRLTKIGALEGNRS